MQSQSAQQRDGRKQPQHKKGSSAATNTKMLLANQKTFILSFIQVRQAVEA
jgi:hypothetical protein